MSKIKLLKTFYLATQKLTFRPMKLYEVRWLLLLEPCSSQS